MHNLKTLPDLADLFAHFAATLTRPVTDQPMGIAQPDSELPRHCEIEKQRHDEKGSDY